MAASCVEAAHSPTSWGQTKGELVYVINDVDDDEDAALVLLLATAPSTHEGLVRDWRNVTVQYHSPDSYIGTVPYRTSTSSPAAGDVIYQFSTVGGTEHISHSLEEIASFPDAGTEPSSKQVIGETENGVEGIDIEAAFWEWTELRYFAAGTITPAYIDALYALTKTVNNAAFYDAVGNGYNAGQILFRGAEGSARSDGTYEITYHFAGRPNVTGVTIGDITAISKLGWYVYDIRYELSEQGSGANKAVIRIPKLVYIQRVYEPGNFDTLYPTTGT